MFTKADSERFINLFRPWWSQALPSLLFPRDIFQQLVIAAWAVAYSKAPRQPAAYKPPLCVSPSTNISNSDILIMCKCICAAKHEQAGPPVLGYQTWAPQNVHGWSSFAA